MNLEDRAAKYRGDPRSTEELLCLALSKDAAVDDHEYWHPIWALQHRLPQIFDQVRRLSESVDEKSRETAATILGQNGVSNKTITNECLERLLIMARAERSSKVLASIAFACGHIHDPRCLEEMLRLKEHPDSDVRSAVVHGLSGHEDNRAIRALIELSSDADMEVRNWATFGLGSQIDSDTPEIRDALVARVQETDLEIRGEALAGLARRGDERVIAPLLKEIEFLKELESYQKDDLRAWTALGEAAGAVACAAAAQGGKIWLPVLAEIKALRIADVVQVEVAIERCQRRMD